jgi:lipopolysaccharide biosynthesis protein
MLLSSKGNLKRLGIFFFYDKYGIVDEYVLFLLKNITDYMSDILVVCNGLLTPEGRQKFEDLGCKVLVRDNVGFDVWAYKEAMSFWGWDNLTEYDELILFNHTIFGPIYPFSEMFEKMDSCDLDFWGITVHHGDPSDPFNKLKRGYLPLHLQSHFIAIRNKMLKSAEFKNYWENMCPITSYEEAICFHEAIFTETFEDFGFSWKPYIDTTDSMEITSYPLMMTPVELLKDYRCPIIKRKSFFLNAGTYLSETCNENASELFSYVKHHTDYDVEMIWDNLLRTCNQSDLKNCLNLNYILSSEIDNQSLRESAKPRVALVMHIFVEELIEYCYRYASSMPAYADIYITTNTEDKKQKIYNIFKNLECNKLSVIIVENRGRDVSALLVGCRDVLLNYDYVCFAHDKSPRNVKPGTIGKAFSYLCFECVLKNKTYVNNVIKTFEENPRIGLLTPPPPNHSDYYLTVGKEWTANFDVSVELSKKLNLTVDISEEKPPIAPLGTIFWFRPKALKILIDFDLKYDDFPKEPVKTDATLMHAIEHLYPLVAQQEGYYPAWLMPDTYAGIYITNIYYYLRQVNLSYFQYQPNFQNIVLTNDGIYKRNPLRYADIFYMNVPLRHRIRIALKLLTPKPVLHLLRLLKYRLIK